MTTAEARTLARTLRAEGLPAPRMYGEGPEAWSAETDLASDLPAARPVLPILKALAAAYGADGAADALTAGDNPQPAYVIVRPETAAETRRGLYSALHAARAALAVDDVDTAAASLAAALDYCANLPE